MPPHILLAGLFHETHTFLGTPTTPADFTVARADEILNKEGDGSPISGFLEVARTKNWKITPTVDMRAMPGGMVADEIFDSFWNEFSSHAIPALRSRLNAIFLVLHGAMVTAGHPDVEGELLARIRRLEGAKRLPIFVVLDLHANISRAMAGHADCLVTYRKNPHTDAHETACRAAQLLNRCLTNGLRPRTVIRQLPIIWAPPGTGTESDPMRTLTRMAAKAEADEVWSVGVAPGFSFADTPDTGVAITVSGTAGLEACADRIAAKAWELRFQGEITYDPVDVVLRRILPITEGPVILVEPSDNIGGGAPGDGTGVLRTFLDHDVADSLIALNDPEAVRRLDRVQPGDAIELSIGGRGSLFDAGPVSLNVTLVSRSDGRFELEDRHSHLASMVGISVNMGRCAVVRHRGITLLLTSHKTPPFDLGQFRSQGIEPTGMKLIGVKAAVAHRRAYDPIARASYFVDTPGPCSSRLDTFPYRRLTRPRFPLDPDAEFHVHPHLS